MWPKEAGRGGSSCAFLAGEHCGFAALSALWRPRRSAIIATAAVPHVLHLHWTGHEKGGARKKGLHIVALKALCYPCRCAPQVAEAAGWFGSMGVRNRTFTEEHARDSFENLMFSMCRSFSLFAAFLSPPASVESVSFGC